MNTGLRIFSKITCFSTLLLIFVGGMVTSTGSGLAVPDWPLSYGMVFPPMVGGVFYEHGHRMAATLVGFLMLILAVWLAFKEPRKWVRVLGFFALGAVIFQGLLGGLTVLFFLPTPVSVSHGVLAQTFFLLTIFISYSQSKERVQREGQITQASQRSFLKALIAFIILIYLQLIFGAIMRHTGSGLAIFDFPTMGGQWFPRFDREMMFTINDWRFENNLDAVSVQQVKYHLIHRLGALIILLAVCFLTALGLKCYRGQKTVISTIYLLDSLIVLQVVLGISSVLTGKAPVLTSIHVMTGALVSGVSFLLLLRVAPLSFHQFRKSVGI